MTRRFWLISAIMISALPISPAASQHEGPKIVQEASTAQLQAMYKRLAAHWNLPAGKNLEGVDESYCSHRADTRRQDSYSTASRKHGERWRLRGSSRKCITSHRSFPTFWHVCSRDIRDVEGVGDFFQYASTAASVMDIPNRKMTDDQRRKVGWVSPIKYHWCQLL